MKIDMSFLGMGIAIWALIIGAVLLARYMGWFTGIPVSKKTAGLGAVLLLGYGLVSGGYIALPGQTAEGPAGPSGPAQAQYLTFNATSTMDNVSTLDDKLVKVEYQISGDNIDVGGNSDISGISWTTTLLRTDTSTDNDLVFSIEANQTQVDNVDADESPFDLYETTSDDEPMVEITPAGKSGSVEYNNLVIGAAGSNDVAFIATPNVTALQNVEVYDSVSSTIVVKGPNGGTQGTIEVQFLRTG